MFGIEQTYSAQLFIVISNFLFMTSSFVEVSTEKQVKNGGKHYERHR